MIGLQIKDSPQVLRFVRRHHYEIRLSSGESLLTFLYKTIERDTDRPPRIYYHFIELANTIKRRHGKTVPHRRISERVIRKLPVREVPFTDFPLWTNAVNIYQSYKEMFSPRRKKRHAHKARPRRAPTYIDV